MELKFRKLMSIEVETVWALYGNIGEGNCATALRLAWMAKNDVKVYAVIRRSVRNGNPSEFALAALLLHGIVALRICPVEMAKIA
jgi:hypothetical protein